MRVRTSFRLLRGDRSLGDASEVTGLSRGTLSRIETGHLFPDDRQVPALVRFYGAPAAWYPAGVARAVHPDLRRCPGCGRTLDPSSAPNRVYHDDACRSEARRPLRAPRAL